MSSFLGSKSTVFGWSGQVCRHWWFMLNWATTECLVIVPQSSILGHVLFIALTQTVLGPVYHYQLTLSIHYTNLWMELNRQKLNEDKTDVLAILLKVSCWFHVGSILDCWQIGKWKVRHMYMYTAAFDHHIKEMWRSLFY